MKKKAGIKLDKCIKCRAQFQVSIEIIRPTMHPQVITNLLSRCRDPNHAGVLPRSLIYLQRISVILLLLSLPYIDEEAQAAIKKT